MREIIKEKQPFVRDEIDADAAASCSGSQCTSSDHYTRQRIRCPPQMKGRAYVRDPPDSSTSAAGARRTHGPPPRSFKRGGSPVRTGVGEKKHSCNGSTARRGPEEELEDHRTARRGGEGDHRKLANELDCSDSTRVGRRAPVWHEGGDVPQVMEATP